MNKYTIYFKTQAFTLAEVLITLMVIGVLAVITIPSILQSWEEQANVAQLRRTYSIIQQAFKLSEIDNGKLGSTALTIGSVAKNFSPYLKVIKDCQGTIAGCFGSQDYVTPRGIALHVSGQPSQNYFYKFLLVDGSAVAIWNPSQSSCSWSNANVNGKTNCAWMYIDVNGPKPPNIMGKDLFGFSINPDGIFPWGGPTTYIDRFAHDSNCKNISLSTSTTSDGAYGCTKWVLERGNMKYLKEVTPWE